MHRLGKWLSVGLVALLVTACNMPAKPGDNAKNGKQADDAEERIVIPVEVQAPARGAISAYFETTTRVEAEDQVQVTSEGTGTCLSVLADEGDRVRRGLVLAELDKEDALAQLRQSEIQVRQSRSDLERAKELYEFGGGARIEYENALYSHENAQASLEVQQIQVNNMTIRAPISGVVTARNVQKGMLVSSGTPVFDIIDPRSFILNINPPEKELPRLRKGQIAKVTIDALDEGEFEAKVTRINPSVDATTGTIKVRLEMDSKIRAKLREAAFARVRLVMETHENALLVPKDAVVEENVRKYVFIVSDEPPETEASGDEEDASDEASTTEGAAGGNTDEANEGADNDEEPRFYAKRVEVEVGLEDSSYTEILSGLDDSDRVVTLGQKTLKPDAEIKLTTADAELAEFGEIPTDEALATAKTKREAIKKRLEKEKQEARALRKKRQDAESDDAKTDESNE